MTFVGLHGAPLRMMLFATLLPVLAPAIPAAAVAQDIGDPAPGTEVTGRLDVLWGMVPALEGQPRIRYTVFDERARATVEIGIDDFTLISMGGLMGINGQRVTARLESAPARGRIGLLAPRTRALAALGRAAYDPTPAMRTGFEAPHDHSMAAFTVDVRPYVTILCKFADVAAEPGTRADYEALMGDQSMSVFDYWDEVSEGRVAFTGSVVVGWITMPNPRSYYFPSGPEADLNRLATDCTNAADPVVDFRQFRGINTQYNASLGCCGWGGGRTLTLDGVQKSYGFTWFPPVTPAASGLGFYAHELGHSLGLPHSGGQYGRTYDSHWDVMSSSSPYSSPSGRRYGAHTVSHHKNILGWVPPERRYIATEREATIVLERHAQPGQNLNTQSVLVPIAGTDAHYTIESRLRIGYDDKLPFEGVLIHHVKPGRMEPAWVVDADGNGNTNDAGAIWTTGETFVDAANGISITVGERTGNAFRVTVRNARGTGLALGATALRQQLVAGAAAVADSVRVELSGAEGASTSWSVSRKGRGGSWLALSTTAGTGSGWLRVRADATLLGPGTYVDSLVVTAGTISRVLLDTLVVSAGTTAHLGVSAVSRSDSTLPPYSRSDSVDVRPSGAGAATMTWTVTKRLAGTGLQTTSGTGPGKVKWNRTSSRAAGLYVDTITISSPGRPSVAVVDSFRVLEPVQIALAARTRRDSMPEGAMAVVDSSRMTFNGRWATSAGWNATHTYWQRPDKHLRLGVTDRTTYSRAGVGNGTIAWQRGDPSRPIGTYVDTIRVQGPFYWYPPANTPGHMGEQLIVDTLRVYAAALQLATWPAARKDSVGAGLAASTDSAQVQVTGSGASTVEWRAISRRARSTLMSYGAFEAAGTGKSSGWLRWVRNTAGLPPGLYVDTIDVTSTSHPSLPVARVIDSVRVLGGAVMTLAAASRSDSIVFASDMQRADSVGVVPIGSAPSTVAWTATKRAAWITLLSSSGTGPGQLRWTRSAAGLALGQVYVDTITVTAPGAYGATARIVDSLRVVAGAVLSTSVASRSDSVVAGGAPFPDSVTVALTGTMTNVSWSASNRAPWNALAVSSGTGSATLRWTRTPGTLPPGTYVDTITVNAPTAVVPTARVIDTMRIAPLPVLSLAESHGRDSTAISTRTDSVKVVLTGSFSNVAWAATNRAGWSALSTPSGTGTGWLRWTRSPQQLAPGTYVDTITITASGASGGPQRYVDTLVVRPPLFIALTAGSRSEALLVGGTRASRDSVDVTVTGFQATGATWTASASSPRISVTTPSGSGAGKVRWTRNRQSLAAGTYVDTIFVRVAATADNIALESRVVDTLRIVTAPAPLTVAADLLGGASVGTEMRALLDREGNADGTFNLGDVLALFDRGGVPLEGPVAAEIMMRAAAPQSSAAPSRPPRGEPGAPVQPSKGAGTRGGRS